MLYDKIMPEAGNSASPAPTELYQALSVNVAAAIPSEHLPAFLAPKGEWFDEDFDFIGPEGEAFTDALLAKVDAMETRERRRRAVDAASHRTFVCKLAANGFRAFLFHNPPLVAVQRGATAYKGRAKGLNGKAMRRETVSLQKAGLIEVNRGEHYVASTTYRVTTEFLSEAMKARITERNLTHRLPPERLVRVYRTNSEDGELIDLGATDEARRWTASLDKYNGFIAKHDIGINLSGDEQALLTARMNEMRQKGAPLLIRPDLIKKDLFRQFNNGSFDAGGRLYGAWWVNSPKELRPLITINGKPTIELDYSCCAVRMLYHENKLECEGDTYFEEAIDACERENGLAKGHFREDVKRMTQALINGRRGGRAERVRLPPRHTFKPYFTRPEVLAMIMAKHARIAHTFQSEAWGWLQRADSDIALAVIGNLMEQGVVALPVHDSFVVAEDDEQRLRQQMINCYFDRFGFNPEIKQGYQRGEGLTTQNP